MPHIVVTISRQIGSGGAFIGQQVARRLGIRYLDREIVREAARILKEDEVALAGREERITGLLENFFLVMAIGTPETGYFPPPLRPLYDQDLFAVESEIIQAVAARESAVIVGRGGFHILRGHPGLTNVFFHASEAFRLARVMDIYNIADTGRAREAVEKSDRARRKFLEAMTGENWTDALAYHLCLDTGTAGFSAAVEMVLRLAEKP